MTRTVNAVAQDESSPQFSVFLGDIGRVGGEGVFDAFKCVASPLVDKGVPVYMALGNHETRYPGTTGYIDTASDEYTAQKAFLSFRRHQ